MTKWLGYILGILGVNVVVTFAAILAFLLFLFRDDPILAALPVVLIAPAILFQPWFVVCSFVGGIYLTPFLTTAITILVYTYLNRFGVLERPKLILLKFKTRKTLAVVGGFFLLFIALVFARYFDFPALHNGLPPPVEFTGVSVTDSRYYCLGKFIDSEWLWQTRIQESEFNVLATKFNLHPVDGDQLPEKFFQMSPYWWHPSHTDNTRFFSTPDFPMNERGADGRHALVSWNPDDQMLYVWMKDNF